MAISLHHRALGPSSVDAARHLLVPGVFWHAALLTERLDETA